MFERFTEGARRVVVLAQEEARLLDHNFIGTEHVLLGLIHEAGVPAPDDHGVITKTFEVLGVSLDVVRTKVEEMVGRGGERPAGHIPFTPRAKKVLELALREALQLGHNYIGPEHILLGLIREGEGVGALALVGQGCDLSRVRQIIIETLASEYYGPSKPSTRGTNDLDAIRQYWASPTAGEKAREAAPGLVEYAQDTISRLCEEIERLRAGGDALYDDVIGRHRDSLDQWDRARRGLA